MLGRNRRVMMPGMLLPLLLSAESIYVMKTIIFPALVGGLPPWDTHYQVSSSAAAEDGIIKGHVLV